MGADWPPFVFVLPVANIYWMKTTSAWMKEYQLPLRTDWFSVCNLPASPQLMHFQSVGVGNR